MKRGFTLIEVASVVGIVAVTCAVLAPTFEQTRLANRTAAARLNIQGFWHGLMAYRSDNESQVEFGAAESMGLPNNEASWFSFVKSYTGDNGRSWRTKSKYTPCGTNNDEEMRGVGLLYFPSSSEIWNKNVLRFHDGSVIMADKNCNPQGTHILCQFCDKRSIGITLGGSVRDKKSDSQSIFDQAFYE